MSVFFKVNFTIGLNCELTPKRIRFSMNSSHGNSKCCCFTIKEMITFISRRVKAWPWHLLRSCPKYLVKSYASHLQTRRDKAISDNLSLVKKDSTDLDVFITLVRKKLVKTESYLRLFEDTYNDRTSSCIISSRRKVKLKSHTLARKFLICQGDFRYRFVRIIINPRSKFVKFLA
ncbi:unnamed protein product [Moneuplotes crassus]|uniref:Uncharacterized protein n=1 Tax=Euplotes crassus TaxID=5936 RepID=A0AAD1XJQ9_EUPCR|nr:unnamed protein product [Moneuplotes crassus]